MALDYAQIVSESEHFFSSELFQRVQLSGLFNDSKTFADAIPYQSYSDVLSCYAEDSSQANFDLALFVATHFRLPEEAELEISQAAETTADYIQGLVVKTAQTC